MKLSVVNANYRKIATTMSTSTASQRQSFKKAIRTQKTFGLFIDSASPLLAEQIASMGGYDWLLIDAQHSPVDIPRLQNMLTAISTQSNCPSLVRVGGPRDVPFIQQALDLGTYGFMVPTIKTVEDVKSVLNVAYFPPLGSRSIAWPIRPQLGRDVSEFLKNANDEVTVILQVETAECYHNIDEILAVPGIDCLFMGPIDLTRDLGLHEKYGFPDCFDTDEFKTICSNVLEACKKHGVATGNFAVSKEKAEALAKQGFSMLATGTDVGLLESAARENIAFVKELKKQYST